MPNLLPEESKNRFFHLYRMHLWTVGLLMFVLISFASIVFLVPALLVFNARINDVSAEIKSIRNDKEVAEAKSLEQEVARARTLLAIGAPESDVLISRFLKVFLLYKTPAISYSYFSVPDESHAEVRGTAKDRQSLSNLVRLLENDPNIARVESPLSNLISEKNISFVISVEWKKTEPEKKQ